MALQSGAVTLVALGADGHPNLRNGTHLRWAVDPQRGFPPLGFDVFRRAHRPGTPSRLDFTTLTARTLTGSETFGATTWRTEDHPPQFRTMQVGSASEQVLRPSRSALTCRFDPALGLVRRVE